MKYEISEYNCYKLDEDKPWGSLYVTEQEIIVFIAEVNECGKIQKTGVSTYNTKTSTCNGNNRKEKSMYNIGKSEYDMVGGIPKWNF